MDDGTLKVCPFCGGGATWVSSGCSVPQMFVVECYNCGVSTPGAYSLPEAIGKWNNRYTEKEPTDD